MIRLLLAALVGAVLLTSSALAQTVEPAGGRSSLQSHGRPPFGGTITASPLEPAAPATGETAGASALVGCAAGATVAQTAAFTIAYTMTTVDFGVGQSFTAPCDGFLTSIAFGQNRNASNVSTTTLMTLYTIQGAGTTGTVLDEVSYSLNNVATAGTSLFTLPLYEPVPVVGGAVYTFFLEYDGGGALRAVASGANPYLGGQVYSGSTAVPTDDLYFVATFQPSTVATTPVVFNGAGYRLLSAPVTGISIRDLAALNLVQGVPGDGTTVDAPTNYPAQYPTALDNLYTGYSGNGAFTPPAFAYDRLQPGRGFFWHWYDQDITPNPTGFGGGTSRSRELTGFTLSQAGPAATANVAQAFTRNADGSYMLGNPFALPLAVSGLTKTAGDGTLTTSVQAYDPLIANYRILFASNPDNAGASDYVAVWDGFFAEVTGGTTAPTFTYAFASTSATATPPFYGRGAATASTTPYVRFRLDGTTDAGAHVADIAAYLRYLPDALDGADADDASKLTPPAGPYALIAPVGTRDGAAWRQAVLSLPTGSTADVTLAFTATTAGTFTLTAEATGLPAEATMRDLVTGQTARLADGYTFTSEATDWAERFVVSFGRSTAGETGAATFALSAAVPNPATSASRVSLRVDAAQTVTATVVDALGRTVQTAFAGALAVGQSQEIAVDTATLAPGVYVVRVSGETFTATRRLVVAR
ncbi:MAG TPA: T9SS type A sorting domain-containing protein [Rubricoccaceae bacterium]|jgi:hypothetical protein